MLERPIRAIYHPGTPGTPAIPYRAAERHCTTAPQGYWTTKTSEVRVKVGVGAMQWPPGATSVRFEVVDGEDWAVFTIRSNVYVPTGPDVITCYEVPEQPYVPAVPAVPARTELVTETGWDAGANSVTVLQGDVSLTFAQPKSVGVVIGLTTDRASVPAMERISHALYFHQDRAGRPVWNVLEGGVLRTPDSKYTEAVRWEIRRVGEQVRYFQGGAEVFRSQTPSHGALSAASCLFATGDMIP